RSEQHDVTTLGRRQDRRGAVRRRQDQVTRTRARRELARRRADVESVHHHALALAADDRVLTELRPQRARLVDLAAAEHALVPRRERLGNRRRRPYHVDDDPDVRRAFLGGCEGGVNTHPGYASCGCPHRPPPATATAIPTVRPVSRAPNAGGPSATSA